MKNITVSVPDEVYRAARIWAAEQGTSVSAIVRGQLVALSKDPEEARREKLRQTLEKIRADYEGKNFDMSENLTRDQLHDRDALR